MRGVICVWLLARQIKVLSSTSALDNFCPWPQIQYYTLNLSLLLSLKKHLDSMQLACSRGLQYHQQWHPKPAQVDKGNTKVAVSGSLHESLDTDTAL